MYASTQQTLFLLNTGWTSYMDFKPRQYPFRLKTVNKFMEQIKAAVEEAKTMIWKIQENITRYYNQRRSSVPVFYLGDQVFLDATDIKTICPSLKLLYHCLRSFIVEQQVRPLIYCLKLPHTIKKLHSIFNVVKLSTAPDNPISRRRPRPLPLPVIINGKEE